MKALDDFTELGRAQSSCLQNMEQIVDFILNAIEKHTLCSLIFELKMQGEDHHSFVLLEALEHLDYF